MEQFFVSDAHCDFLYYMTTKDWDIGALRDKQVIHLPYLQQGNVALQFFAAWIDVGLDKPYWKQCTDMLDGYARMLEKYSEALTPFTAAFQPGGGKIACLPTVEGGEALEGDPARLDALYERGVRAMTLTWNDRNELAFPAMGRRNAGLTMRGKAVVDRMCELGIAVDLAHLNDAGIDDVLSRASRPVFASHSNARSVFNSKRALCDTHIRAIAETGGVVCVNFYPRQLCKGMAGMDDIIRHIDHMVEIAGGAHVGLGSDFDGMSCYPKDLRDSRDYPALLNRMLAHGYTEELVKKIAYDNLRDYIAQFCA